MPQTCLISGLPFLNSLNCLYVSLFCRSPKSWKQIWTCVLLRYSEISEFCICATPRNAFSKKEQFSWRIRCPVAPFQFFKVYYEVLPFLILGSGVVRGGGGGREGRRKGGGERKRERGKLLPLINGMNFNSSRLLNFSFFEIGKCWKFSS